MTTALTRNVQLHSVLQGISQSYSRVILQSRTSRATLSAAINMSFVVFTIILYILSIIKLRQHQKNSKNLGKKNWSQYN